jgi:hypothetical protein
MKNLLILFGVLDFIAVLKSYKGIYQLSFANSNFQWMDLVILLIYFSLIASGFYLIKKNKIGLWISYLQFPLRLLFVIFSFGFLLIINGMLNQLIGMYVLTIILAVLEIIRLAITILIHRKYYR